MRHPRPPAPVEPADATLAVQTMQRLDALGNLTDEPGRLTRLAYGPALRRAHELVAGWMREADLSVREDAASNLIGRLEGRAVGARALLLGSHLDTVREAGRFDGMLGILTALATVQKLQAEQRRLPFAVEIIAFADEEGVRFHTAYVGSRAFAGTLAEADLQRTDASGITLAEAMRQFGGNPTEAIRMRRDPRTLLGYVEVHIEQGPELEQSRCPLGVVTALCGQTRVAVDFLGRAAHAGTTPMTLRRDALAGAAEFITLAEKAGQAMAKLVVTVGELQVSPGASNVIPGAVRLSLDVRHPQDSPRTGAVEHLRYQARKIAGRRGLQLEWHVAQSTSAVPCDPALRLALKQALRTMQGSSPQLPSGAGHDAAALAAITPVAMLFVRCRDGVSHHPAESVATDDVRMAIAVLHEFLLQFEG